MFNIANNQRNVNQNHDVNQNHHLTPIRMAIIRKTKKKKKLGKDVGKSEPSCTVGGNVN